MSRWFVTLHIRNWEDEDFSRKQIKSIFCDLVKPLKVTDLMALEWCIKLEEQGRLISPPPRLRPMRGEILTEFAEQRKLQAELCN